LRVLEFSWQLHAVLFPGIQQASSVGSMHVAELGNAHWRAGLPKKAQRRRGALTASWALVAKRVGAVGRRERCSNTSTKCGMELTFVDTYSLEQGVLIMQKHRKPYPAEFRAQMVELVRAGRTPEELAQEFEPTAASIYNWLAQAERDAGRRHDGLTTVEHEELTRLRRKVRQLELERDILSKAAAWFARETGTLPEKGSSS
jgi:transposase